MIKVVVFEKENDGVNHFPIVNVKAVDIPGGKIWVGDEVSFGVGISHCFQARILTFACQNPSPLLLLQHHSWL
jgi:hypothetical protein